jgi:hypothetical protein
VQVSWQQWGMTTQARQGYDAKIKIMPMPFVFFVFLFFSGGTEGNSRMKYEFRGHQNAIEKATRLLVLLGWCWFLVSGETLRSRISKI